MTITNTWTPVCALTDLIVGRGVAALLDDATQVAVFYLGDEDGEPVVHAVSNIDPFGRAAVMSRGLVGEHGGTATVASPLLKQRFSLESGRCLDDESVVLPVYPVRVIDGRVEVGSAQVTPQ